RGGGSRPSGPRQRGGQPLVLRAQRRVFGLDLGQARLDACAGAPRLLELVLQLLDLGGVLGAEAAQLLLELIGGRAQLALLAAQLGRLTDARLARRQLTLALGQILLGRAALGGRGLAARLELGGPL